MSASVLVSLGVNSISVNVPPWPSPYWDIPGDFCRGRYPALNCCSGRQDRCSVPIMGTLCYCDSFCNRTMNADCCPDYFPHCEGLEVDDRYQAVEKPPESIALPPGNCEHGILNNSYPVCVYKGVSYTQRDKIQDNCNICNCQVSTLKPGCMEVFCSREQCLVEPDVVQEINRGADTGVYGWRARNYTEYWGRTLEEGVKGRLGAIRPDYPVSNQVAHMSAIQFSYAPSTLPRAFQADQRWPRLLSDVKDQGWCSSSWALSTVGVASDRISIGRGERVNLGAQGLLNCDTRGQAGCKGGHVDQAWHFLRKTGSWEEDCIPYRGSPSVCQIPRCHAYRTQPAYRVGRSNTYTLPRRREHDIMYEISNQGPVQTILQINTDFFMYTSGVYKKTNLARPEPAGHHAMRIVGWGEDETGLKYWTLANSWGREWGEQGLVRVARGTNECKVEEFVLGVWPRRERRRPRTRHNQRDTNRYFSERSGRHRIRHNRHRHRQQQQQRQQRRHQHQSANAGHKKYYQLG